MISNLKKKVSIGVIDYQSGNLSSLINSIKRMSYNVEIIKNSKDVHKFNKIILPGVGSFERASLILKKKKFDIELKKYLKKKKNYLLGICLGMQILLKDSDEKRDKSKKNIGLSLIDGRVIKFKSQGILSNIGWSDLNIIKKGNSLFKNSEGYNSPVYFVHQYHCVVSEKKIITSESNFNKINFCSSFQKDNIFGTQFHPEKSSKFGEAILKNFLSL